MTTITPYEEKGEEPEAEDIDMDDIAADIEELVTDIDAIKTRLVDEATPKAAKKLFSFARSLQKLVDRYED